jgi:ribosomal subunit interface protein
MDISIVGRHTRVSDDMRERIHAKMAKIAVLAPKATRVEIHVVHERNPRMAADAERVEITLHDRGVIRVEASADDRVAALELAATRISDRLRKLHERRAHRHQGAPAIREVVEADAAATTTDSPVESVETWEGAPGDSVREIPLDGTPIVIRSKTHSAEPMSVPEAIDQMELVGHDFYLFLDSESRLPSAVYRRRGWTYGVIHIDPEEADTSERKSA